jgi:putative FmdB family regulatory protein
MPIYEYLCPEGHQFEEKKNMGARQFAVCPECTQRAKLVFSPVNHTFGFRLTEQSHLSNHKDEFERAV